MTDPAPDALREAYEAGATVEQLALEHGRNPDAIRRYLRDAGTEMRRKGARTGVPQGNVAASPSQSRAHLDPAARIVRPSLARAYR